MLILRQYHENCQGIQIDFAGVSHKTIQAIEDRLNKRPRKVLGYKTPVEVFFASENNSITTCKSIAFQS